LRFAVDSFEQRFQQDPRWDRSTRDLAQVLTLVKSEADAQEFIRRWEFYAASTEEFTARQKLSLSYFCGSGWNRFIDGPQHEPAKNKADRRKETNERNLATAAERIASRRARIPAPDHGRIPRRVGD
jgi:hypothetical protein